MKAVILAAGAGNRLSTVSGGVPKSMIEFSGKSIMHRQIETCWNSGIRDFIIVLGYKYELMKSHISEVLKPENITFVDNPIYATTNTLHSLWLAGDKIEDDFIYFNADVMFREDLLNKIIKQTEHSQLLLETKSCAEEEVKMIIDEDFRILEISKQLDIPKCAGEFIGIGKFNKEVLPFFIKYLKLGTETGHSNNYFEYAVDLMAKDVFLQAVPTDGIPCIEIDFPEDLEKAKKMFG
jgi:choline kinase